MRHWNPEQVNLLLKKSPNYIKLVVLSKFLLEGKIDIYQLSLDLCKEGIIFDKNSIDSCYEFCGVIDNYCKTGKQIAEGD